MKLKKENHALKKDVAKLKADAPVDVAVLIGGGEEKKPAKPKHIKNITRRDALSALRNHRTIGKTNG